MCEQCIDTVYHYFVSLLSEVINMMTLIIVTACLTTYELLAILYKFSPKFLKTALGYEVWIDLFFGGVLTIAAASTGSMIALVISVVSGFFISITLALTKKFLGYRKYEKDIVTGKRKWVEYPSEWGAETVGQGIRLIGCKVFSKLKSTAKGFTNNGKIAGNAV
jgi:hypothetical protein